MKPLVQRLERVLKSLIEAPDKELAHRALAVVNLVAAKDKNISQAYSQINFPKILLNADEFLLIEALQLLVHATEFTLFKSVLPLVTLLEEALSNELTEQAQLCLIIFS